MLFDDPACFRLDCIPVRPIHWLWRPYLACGKLAVLDGDPGPGKSLFTADFAARLDPRRTDARRLLAPQEGQRPLPQRRR